MLSLCWFQLFGQLKDLQREAETILWNTYCLLASLSPTVWGVAFRLILKPAFIIPQYVYSCTSVSANMEYLYCAAWLDTDECQYKGRHQMVIMSQLKRTTCHSIVVFSCYEYCRGVKVAEVVAEVWQGKLRCAKCVFSMLLWESMMVKHLDIDLQPQIFAHTVRWGHCFILANYSALSSFRFAFNP